MERYFKHFKGGIYKLLYTAKHSETKEDMVVYQAMYGDNQVWVRPATMFFGMKEVDGKMVHRFTEIEKPKSNGLVNVKFKKMHPNAKIPTKAHESDAGFDMTSAIDIVIPERGKALIDTGVALEILQGCFGMVVGRSGNTIKRGLLGATGIIDSGYRGSIGVMAFNMTDHDIFIKAGERIGQIIIIPVRNVYISEVEELSESDRKGGFGSTGK